MTIDEKIKDKKLQYEINRAATKIYALSSKEKGKHKYLLGYTILTPQNYITSQIHLFNTWKAFEKEKKHRRTQEKTS